MSTGSSKPFRRSNSGLETQLWLHLSQLRAAPAPAQRHLARPAIRARAGGDTTLLGPTTRPLAWAPAAAPPPQQPQTPSRLLGSEASSLADPTPRRPPALGPLRGDCRGRSSQWEKLGQQQHGGYSTLWTLPEQPLPTATMPDPLPKGFPKFETDRFYL